MNTQKEPLKENLVLHPHIPANHLERVSESCEVCHAFQALIRDYNERRVEEEDYIPASRPCDACENNGRIDFTKVASGSLLTLCNKHFNARIVPVPQPPQGESEHDDVKCRSRRHYENSPVLIDVMPVTTCPCKCHKREEKWESSSYRCSQGEHQYCSVPDRCPCYCHAKREEGKCEYCGK